MYFKPSGVQKSVLDETPISVDEYKAVRLKDFQGLDQAQAAPEMRISQPTFHRLVISARKKIADAIINSKALRIKGCCYQVMQPRRRMQRMIRFHANI